MQDLELAVALNLFLSRIGERSGAALASLSTAGEAYLAMASAVQRTLHAAEGVETALQRVPAANLDIAVLPVSAGAGLVPCVTVVSGAM